jgi:hypothetical protein
MIFGVSHAQRPPLQRLSCAPGMFQVRVAKRVDDKRLLKLIRAFLNAGVMENGLISPSVEGTPQGDLFRRCSAMSCSTNSTANWSAGDIDTFVTQTIATSRSGSSIDAAI